MHSDALSLSLEYVVKDSQHFSFKSKGRRRSRFKVFAVFIPRPSYDEKIFHRNFWILGQNPRIEFDLVRFSNVRLKGLGHAILGNFTKFNFVNYELQNFSVLFSFMTVFAVKTRGFSNTSGRLERRHKEENSMPTWAVLQCKTRLQQFFFKFATQPSSHRTVFSRTDQWISW